LNGLLSLLLIVIVVPVSFLRLLILIRRKMKGGEIEWKSVLWMGEKMSAVFVLTLLLIFLIPNHFTYHIYIHTHALIITLLWVFLMKEICLAFLEYKGGKRTAARIRAYIGILAMLVIFTIVITPSFRPEVYSNDITEQMWEKGLEKGYPAEVITSENYQQIRVVPWSIAGEVLQRAYAEESARLSTDTSDLTRMADPTIYQGKFVWVNFPVFESWKWMGGKEIPFFLYVENSEKSVEPVVMNVTLKINRERISWKNRVDATLYNHFADYKIYQIRSDIGDDGRPYHVVYLSQRDWIYNFHVLKKVLIIDAHTGDWKAYDVDSPRIPEWLEVVYPDEYVYDYVSWWGKYHRPIGYRLFNKKGMYSPDDSAARFIQLGNRTYWQILLKHQTSNVLAGYVMVDTRTGELTFHDRSNIYRVGKDGSSTKVNYVSRETAIAQVQKYLASGEMGFRQLAVHEGYLYPIEIGENVTERYIFPCYAGLSLKKIAIVDPVDYRKVIVVESLSDVIRTVVAEDTRLSAVKGVFKIENAAEVEGRVLLQINGTVYEITKDQLSYGDSSDASREWDELHLAVYRWLSGREAYVELTITGETVVDVFIVNEAE